MGDGNGGGTGSAAVGRITLRGMLRERDGSHGVRLYKDRGVIDNGSDDKL